MEQLAHEPRTVSLSIRLYQVLLQVYPTAFRREYGWLMLQAFGDCCRRAFQQAGPAGLLPLWARTMLDTLATAIEEHTQRGTDMSKDKFVKLSGWAFVAGGLSLFIGWLASSRPDYDPRNYYSLGIDRIANAITAPLILVALIMISLGLLGLWSRFGSASSSAGRFILVAGAAAGFIAAAAWLLETIRVRVLDSEVGWFVFMYSMALMFASLALWGIECLRKRFLPRGSGLALLAGIWMPAFIVITSIAEAITGAWTPLPGSLDLLLFGVTSISMVVLGYQLQSDSAAETALAT